VKSKKINDLENAVPKFFGIFESPRLRLEISFRKKHKQNNCAVSSRASDTGITRSLSLSKGEEHRNCPLPEALEGRRALPEALEGRRAHRNCPLPEALEGRREHRNCPLPEALEGRRAHRNCGVFEVLRHRNWAVPVSEQAIKLKKPSHRIRSFLSMAVKEIKRDRPTLG